MNINSFIATCESMMISEVDIALEGLFTADKDVKSIYMENDNLVDFISVRGRKTGFNIPSEKWIKGFWEVNTEVSANFLNNLNAVDRCLSICEAAYKDYMSFADDWTNMSDSEQNERTAAFRINYMEKLSVYFNNKEQFKGLPKTPSKAEMAKVEKLSERFVHGMRNSANAYFRVIQQYEKQSTLKKTFASASAYKKAGMNWCVKILYEAYTQIWAIFSIAVS